MSSLLIYYLISSTTPSMSMSLVSGWSLSPTTSTIIAPKSHPINSRNWRRRQHQQHRPLPNFRQSDNFRLYDNINFEKEDTNNDDEVEDDNIEENDKSKNIEYFDDFDFVIGENTDTGYADGASRENDDINNINKNNNTKDEALLSPSSSSSMLNQRFQALALNEQLNRQQISDNWKDGYWGVWGCSLAGEDNNDDKTIVTCMRQAVSVFDDDDDDDDEDITLLIVGRSDGSICWLQMETIPSPSYDKNANNNGVDNRSITTYFENKLVAKETDNGSMIVDTALQRENNDVDNDIDDDDDRSSSASQSPFEVLSQIQTSSKSSSSSTSAAIVDMLILPAACRMIWTISHDSPNSIQGWKLIPNEETGFLLPISITSSSSSSSSSDIKIKIETIHTSSIVAMKIIPKNNVDDSSSTFIVSVSDNGQVVVWEVLSSSSSSSSGGNIDIDSESTEIKIRLDANLLRQQQEEEEEYDDRHSDSILSMEVDDEYLYLGSQAGRISIFALSTIVGESSSGENDLVDLHTPVAGPLQSLPLAKSFLAFTTKEPGVSTICAAGPGTLGDTTDDRSSSNSSRPPSKSLIAGNVGGGIKQWELIQAGIGRLEYWPRMASQRLPKGKTHVYETKEGRDNYDYGDYDDDDDDEHSSPSIRGLLCIQQVLLAATDHGLTFWDSTTGKALYDMQGLKFSAVVGGRPNLVAVNDSVLVTNGMDQYVCVHDFSMDRFSDGDGGDDDYDDW